MRLSAAGSNAAVDLHLDRGDAARVAAATCTTVSAQEMVAFWRGGDHHRGRRGVAAGRCR
jgi:hypothetical protein